MKKINKLYWIVIGTLVLIIGIQSVVFGYAYTKLEKRVATLEYNEQTIKDMAKKIDETGNQTAYDLYKTIQALEATVEVYDNNVAIYNRQIKELQDVVNSIVDYLN